MTFPTKPLLELCTVRTGKMDANHGKPGDLYPFFTCAAEPIQSPTYSFDGDSIVLPGNGANVGLVIFYSGKFEAYQRTYVLSDFKCDARYVYHHLKCHWKVINASSQYGSATNYIRMGNFENYALPLPPYLEQRRIAEVLDRAEALRAKRRAALAQLDELTQAIFLDMFGDPTPQTHRFPIEPLKTVLRQPLQNGAYYPKESYTEVGGVEMVHMSDAFYEVVPRGKLKRVITSKQDLEKYALTEFDILVARRSLTLEGAAKPCCIPRSSEPLIFESSFIRVTPAPAKLSAVYFYHYLRNDRVKLKCIQPYVTQSTISGINQSNLERVPVIVPPIELQHEFARRVTAVETLKTAHRASLAELDALFASLQHRAFRGEL